MHYLPCLYAQCGAAPFPDPDALDQHYKQVHVPMWATPYSTTQNHGPTISTTQDRPAQLNVHYTLPLQSGNSNYDTLRYDFDRDASTGKYRCPDCGALASRMADMERHMKKHQPESKGFDCLVCDRHGEHGFARKDKLKDHLRAKHKLLM